MYSRNYGFSEDTPSKITPPPDYSGSAIQSSEPAPPPERQNEQTFAPYPSQSAQFRPQEVREEADRGSCQNPPHPPSKPCEYAGRCECAQKPCESPPPKKDKGFLSGFLSDMCTEDLILLGIIAALAFGIADNDILLVALVVAVVLM